MTEEQAERMGFREWTEHYEKEQEQQRSQIGELTKNVSSLSADVRTLVENQRGMFSRMNRPIAPLVIAAFAVLISLSGMFFTLLTLTVNPIQDDIVHIERTMISDEDRQREIHMMLTERLIENTVKIAKQEESQRWLEKIEERYDKRTHRGE